MLNTMTEQAKEESNHEINNSNIIKMTDEQLGQVMQSIGNLGGLITGITQRLDTANSRT